MSEKILREYNDLSGRLTCVAKQKVGYDEFSMISERLISQFDGNIMEKVEDGFSQRYWDVQIDNAKVCFHYDDMILDFEIISLEGTKSDDLVRRLATALA